MSIGLIIIAIGTGLGLSIVGLALFTALAARRAEVSAPPIGRFIEVDGARLHYLDRGTGPVVVIVHGLAGNLRNFYELVHKLAVSCRVVVATVSWV